MRNGAVSPAVCFAFIMVMVTGNVCGQWSKVNRDTTLAFTRTCFFDGKLLAGVRMKNGTSYSLFCSTDYGVSWYSFQDGVEADPLFGDCYIVELSQYDSLLYAATSNGLYVVSQSSSAWRRLSKGIKYDFIRGIHRAGNRLFIPCDSSRILVSGDLGESWNLLAQLQPYADKGSLWDFRHLGNILIVMLDARRAGSPDKLIYRSTDQGVTWEWIFVSSKDYYWFVGQSHIVCSLLYGDMYFSADGGTSFSTIRPKELNGKYLPTTYVGNGFILGWGKDTSFFSPPSESIFISSDDGLSWHDIGEGLSGHRFVNSFTCDDRYAYAAATDGLWRRPLSEIVAVREAPSGSKEGINIIANYPEPIQNTSNISYSIERLSYIRLHLCDVLGRTVRLLDEKECAPGEYTTILTTVGLPNGVYLIVLEAGNRRATKRVIVVH